MALNALVLGRLSFATVRKSVGLKGLRSIRNHCYFSKLSYLVFS